MSTSTTPPRHLSHSQLETFSQCPRKWWLQKVAHVEQAPSEHLIFGSAIHAVLETDGARLVAGKESLPMTYLVAGFVRALANEYVKADPRHLLPLSLMADLKVRGLAVLRTYADHVQPEYKPLAVEEAFSLPIPEMPGWTFTGRIDARLALAVTTDIIVDFKTASKPWRLGDEHNKTQATAYAWAQEAVRPDPSENLLHRTDFMTLPAVKTAEGGYDCTLDRRTTWRTRGQINAFIRDVQRVASHIEAVGTESPQGYAPRTGPLCPWCPVQGSCQAGQQWITDHGKTPAVPVIWPVRATPTPKPGGAA